MPLDLLINAHCFNKFPQIIWIFGAGARRLGGVVMDLPKCQKCNNGTLIPLSDYGQEGASVIFKAWACTNPDCGFSLRVDKGEVSYGRRIEPKH
jgi:hypothetical protein